MTAHKERKRFNSIYYFMKRIEVDNIIPGWTGFNIQLEGTKVPLITEVGYLPVIDANPVEDTTVQTILDCSVAIANKLGLDSIVVMDQSLYARAQAIRWKKKIYF